MKGKKFYVLLMSLILVGLGSFFLHRYQQEQRVLEFEGYEISTIEDRVEGLYNEEKTDIAEDISNEEIEELTTIFEELDEKNLNRRNRDHIKDVEIDFLIAREMLRTEEKVKDVFDEVNVVKKDVSEEDIDTLEVDVLTFETKTDYVDRNIELLAYARQQIIRINDAREFVESLFDDEGNVLETVTRDDEEEALELLDTIRNEEVREELAAQLETVRLVLTEREELLALEEMETLEALEVQEDVEVEEMEEAEDDAEEIQYTAPPASEWTPPANSNTGENTGGSNPTWNPAPAPPAQEEGSPESEVEPELEEGTEREGEPDHEEPDEEPEVENGEEETDPESGQPDHPSGDN